MSVTFRFNTKKTFSAVFPTTVSRAADVLIAIANRLDTPKIVGDKSNVNHRDNSYMLPLATSVVSQVLGEYIAKNYVGAMTNPACFDFYALVNDRLFNVGLTLAYSRSYWFLVKMPHNAMEDEVSDPYAYDIDDLLEQVPAGYVGSAAEIKKYPMGKPY